MTIDARGYPQGVHQWDPSQPVGPGFGSDAAPVQHPEQAYRQAPRPPFPVENSQALGVFQRSSHDFSTFVVVATTTSGGSGVAKVVGRQKGRRSVQIFVPANLPQGGANPGVIIGNDESEVQNAAFTLGTTGVPGPIIIYTEAAVWIGVIPGQSAGCVYAISEINPNQVPPNV